MQSSAKILILAGGKISGKSYAAKAAQKQFPVAVIAQDDAIKDIKDERNDRVMELNFLKDTAGELIKSGFLEELDSHQFLRNWYKQRLSDAASPVIILEGWFFHMAAHRKILYEVAAQVFHTCSFHLVSYEPPDNEAAKRLAKRKGEPVQLRDIRRRRGKNESRFEEPNEDEPLIEFLRCSELDEVLDLVKSMRNQF